MQAGTSSSSQPNTILEPRRDSHDRASRITLHASSHRSALPIIIHQSVGFIHSAKSHLKRLVDSHFLGIAIGHLHVSSAPAFKIDHTHDGGWIRVGIQVIERKREQRRSLVGESNTLERVFFLTAYTQVLVWMLDLPAIQAAITVQAVDIVPAPPRERDGGCRRLSTRSFGLD